MTKTNIGLSINREGTFSILAEQCCDTQCGFNNQTSYKYFVSIQGTGENVKQPEMFLLDNMVIRDYFQTRFIEERNTVKSCETVALDAVEHFRDMFVSTYGNDPKRILVRIHGAMESFIEATWPLEK